MYNQGDVILVSGPSKAGSTSFSLYLASLYGEENLDSIVRDLGRKNCHDFFSKEDLPYPNSADCFKKELGPRQAIRTIETERGKFDALFNIRRLESVLNEEQIREYITSSYQRVVVNGPSDKLDPYFDPSCRIRSAVILTGEPSGEDIVPSECKLVMEDFAGAELRRFYTQAWEVLRRSCANREDSLHPMLEEMANRNGTSPEDEFAAYLLAFSFDQFIQRQLKGKTLSEVNDAIRSKVHGGPVHSLDAYFTNYKEAWGTQFYLIGRELAMTAQGETGDRDFRVNVANAMSNLGLSYKRVEESGLQVVTGDRWKTINQVTNFIKQDGLKGINQLPALCAVLGTYVRDLTPPMLAEAVSRSVPQSEEAVAVVNHLYMLHEFNISPEHMKSLESDLVRLWKEKLLSGHGTISGSYNDAPTNFDYISYQLNESPIATRPIGIVPLSNKLEDLWKSSRIPIGIARYMMQGFAGTSAGAGSKWTEEFKHYQKFAFDHLGIQIHDFGWFGHDSDVKRLATSKGMKIALNGHKYKAIVRDQLTFQNPQANHMLGIVPSKALPPGKGNRLANLGRLLTGSSRFAAKGDDL